MNCAGEARSLSRLFILKGDECWKMKSDYLKLMLATAIRESNGSYVVEEIINRFPTIPELLEASVMELSQIPGLGKIRAKTLYAAINLARLLNSSKQQQGSIIRNPEDAYQFIRGELEFLQKEHFVIIFLNTKNGILGYETISVGSLNCAIVHPREVYKAAIKRSCASIVVVHNHPSGDPQPSHEDLELTNRLVEAGQIIGIELLDHIIIGHSNYISLKEKGLL